LEIGGWPPIAIWVNDDLVWNQTEPHGYHPNADRVAVTLQKGDNRILLSGAVMAFVGIGEQDDTPHLPAPLREALQTGGVDCKRTESRRAMNRNASVGNRE